MISEHHVLWMDNGRNDTDRSMLGTGSSPDPVRLWWVRQDDERSIRSVEISGLPYGTESNPPAWDHRGGVVVAYDAGNAVLRAWRLAGDELEPLWRRDGFAHAGHLIHFPDTRELIAGDWQDRGTPSNRRLRRAMSLAGRPVFTRVAGRRGGRRCGSVTTSSWCSTSTPARRRRGPRSPLPHRAFCSRRPATGATSTTSRCRRSRASRSCAEGATSARPQPRGERASRNPNPGGLKWQSR